MNDVCVAENIAGSYYANLITEYLNDYMGGSSSTYFYKVVEDDYELYEFEV